MEKDELKERLDALWVRYDAARRAGFFADALKIKDEYEKALRRLDVVVEHELGRR